MLRWESIVAEAARIARSYSTPVTLRQLHYRLVAASVGGYDNTTSCYKRLSELTAQARREGRFPRLLDTTRSATREACWQSIADALGDIADRFRLDHTDGQDHQIWVLFEKATLAAQIQTWTSPYGLTTAALRGYSSESLEHQIFGLVDSDGRPAVVFYVGDLDPEGEDIERNFCDQADEAGCYFKHWERLAVLPEQIEELGLVPNPGKETSSRAGGFVARHGQLFQIETEAVDPAELERLVMDAITDSRWFDSAVYDDVIDRETEDRRRLEEFVADHEDDD